MQVMFWLSSISFAVEKKVQKRFLEEAWPKKKAKVSSKSVYSGKCIIYRVDGSLISNWICYLYAENSDISSALSKLTEPSATVPIHKLSVSNMVHSARKHIRRNRHMDESPLNTGILNSIMLVRKCCYIILISWALKPLNVFVIYKLKIYFQTYKVKCDILLQQCNFH